MFTRKRRFSILLTDTARSSGAGHTDRSTDDNTSYFRGVHAALGYINRRSALLSRLSVSWSQPTVVIWTRKALSRIPSSIRRCVDFSDVCTYQYSHKQFIETHRDDLQTNTTTMKAQAIWSTLISRMCD